VAVTENSEAGQQVVLMKTLLVLRHAKSSWDNPRLADFERPLNKRGKRDAPRMGELIKREEIVPDLIISSSAKRALSTAEAVAQACDYESEIQTTRLLYLAGPDEYLEVINAIADVYDRVMVVGHNPGMESLVEDLTGEWLRMPTAALAQIRLNIDSWSELALESDEELVDYWQPKELT
jgi:phosphohistidine phosphatase